MDLLRENLVQNVNKSVHHQVNLRSNRVDRGEVLFRRLVDLEGSLFSKIMDQWIKIVDLGGALCSKVVDLDGHLFRRILGLEENRLPKVQDQGENLFKMIVIQEASLLRKVMRR